MMRHSEENAGAFPLVNLYIDSISKKDAAKKRIYVTVRIYFFQEYKISKIL